MRSSFIGFPVIRRYPTSEIMIGHDCTLNSSKNSIKECLVKPITLVTKTKEAKIIIGDSCGISGSLLVSASKIEIGNNVQIGANCTFFDTDFHHTDPIKELNDEPVPTKQIIIEDHVFIGANCTFLKGVTIGEYSVIGAGSVVFHSIPKHSIAIGNPCKIVIMKNQEGRCI